jgi:hypothetical protein
MKLKVFLPVFCLVFVLLLVGPAQVYAASIPKLSAGDLEQLFSENGDGMYLCDNDASYASAGCTEAEASYSGRELETTLIVFNIPLHAEFFLSKGHPENGRKIIINYQGEGEVLCTYEFLSEGLLPCTQAIGGDSAIHPYTLGGASNPNAYILNLNELCREDSDGNGFDCALKWNDRINSYSVSAPQPIVPEPLEPSEPLEPPSPEPPEPEYIALGLTKKVTDFYKWALSVGGIVALIVIVYGGFLYTTSGGSPERIKNAKSWIAAAFSGMLLLYGSFILLNLINPELTTPREILLPINPTPDPTEESEIEGIAFGGARGGPADCFGDICSRAEFVAYAKGLAHSRDWEVKGNAAPSDPNLVAYVNTDPTITKCFDSENSDCRCYGAECGVYVGTVITNSIDPNFPDRGTERQWNYLVNQYQNGDGNGHWNYDYFELDYNTDTSRLGEILEPGDILMPVNYLDRDMDGVSELHNCLAPHEDAAYYENCALPHGHIALWLGDGVYEAALGTNDLEQCLEGYMPRGPRGDAKDASGNPMNRGAWNPIMNAVFRFRAFEDSTSVVTSPSSSLGTLGTAHTGAGIISGQAADPCSFGQCVDACVNNFIGSLSDPDEIFHYPGFYQSCEDSCARDIYSNSYCPDPCDLDACIEYYEDIAEDYNAHVEPGELEDMCEYRIENTSICDMSCIDRCELYVHPNPTDHYMCQRECE